MEMTRAEVVTITKRAICPQTHHVIRRTMDDIFAMNTTTITPAVRYYTSSNAWSKDASLQVKVSHSVSHSKSNGPFVEVCVAWGIPMGDTFSVRIG